MAWLTDWNLRKQLYINGPYNIVPDNSLAGNSPFWALPSGSFSRNTTFGHSDTYSIQGTSLTPQSYTTNKFAISSTTLTVSGWVYSTGNTNRFGINTYDSAGTLLHSSDTWNVGGSSSASWTYLSSTFTVESNATQVSFRFITGEGSPTSGVAYWDDISLVQATGPDQTNYQMKITVNFGIGTDTPGNIYCGGNCRSDFGDIRFTGSDGTTLLNYWIESSTPSSNAVMWIQISSIPAGSNSTNIYIYYNNPSATSQSNGTNTFPFFDNFVDNSLDITKWIKGGAFSANINEINQRIEYYMPHSWDSNVYTYLMTNMLSNSKYWTWTYNHVNDMNGRSESFEVDFSVDGSTWTQTWILGRWSGSTYSDGVLSSAYNGLWEFKWNGINSIEMFVAGISKGTKPLANQPKFVRLQQHGVDTTYAGNLQFQLYNFRGRNYITTEPAWSSTISAQSVPLNTAIAFFVAGD